jgi:phosphohistidine phosphatase
MPALKLVSHKLCPYVQRAVIALAEKNVPFERVDVDLADKPDWFKAVSPLGKTPVLMVHAPEKWSPVFREGYAPLEESRACSDSAGTEHALDSRAIEIDAVAMRLLLLRHAKAERGEPGMSDRDRPLNPRGYKDAPRIGAYMAHHALQPDRVVVSDSRRTRETWNGVSGALPASPPVTFEDVLYQAEPGAILELARESPRSAHCVLLVGHNPGLHDAARMLIATGDTAARERLNEGLPTSGLLVIDFAGKDWNKLTPRSGRLERFITPRSLKAAAD